VNISQYELSVLKAFDGLGDYGKTLDQISADAEIPRVKIRRFVRSLARKDMLELALVR
jgi:DNA-binding IclR family transcriptional regulator